MPQPETPTGNVTGSERFTKLFTVRSVMSEYYGDFSIVTMTGAIGTPLFVRDAKTGNVYPMSAVVSLQR